MDKPDVTANTPFDNYLNWFMDQEEVLLSCLNSNGHWVACR